MKSATNLAGPVCRLEQKSVMRYLDGQFYVNVNNPDFRDQLRAILDTLKSLEKRKPSRQELEARNEEAFEKLEKEDAGSTRLNSR